MIVASNEDLNRWNEHLAFNTVERLNRYLIASYNDIKRENYVKKRKRTSTKRQKWIS